MPPRAANAASWRIFERMPDFAVQGRVCRAFVAHRILLPGPRGRPRQPSVASPIICRSALAIEAHRGVASLANTLGIGCALRLALRSDGCAQPTTSDR